MKTDLGVVPDKDPTPCCDTEPPKGPNYPSVCFRGEQHDRLIEAIGDRPEIGDLITCRSTFKVTGMREDKYDRSIDLECHSLEEVEVSQADEPKAKTESKAKADKEGY